MSSILKALKKLEEEKTIRKPGSLKIDAEILRGDASRHFSSMSISLLAVLLFICGSGATYVFMKPDAGSKKHTVASAMAPIAQPSSATAIDPVAVQPQNMNLQAGLPKRDKRKSAGSDIKDGNTPLSSAIAPSLPVRIQAVPPIKQSEVKRPVAPIQPAPAIRPVAVIVPALKVNGIAFQDESADRVAIVNGISVSSGSMIEGAKVEDIQKDRVMFSYGGEKFDVALGKSNR